MVSFEDFKTLDIRAAKILSAEKIAESEKLIKLRVQLESEERQIVAGIGTKYSPEELIGKRIVIISNLEPRKLMGEESQGMLLAAHDENGDPVLIVPEKEVPPGSKVS